MRSRACRPRLMAIAAALAIGTVAVGAVVSSPAAADGGVPLETVVVASRDAARRTGYDGRVEAVRQTIVASQVPGTVVELDVRAGDRVKAGQTLARLDARAAVQQAGAAAAQVRAAKAAASAAEAEYQRQQKLFEKNYVSQAALERAEAQYRTAAARATAELASAEAARTETDYFLVKAPYDGVISAVDVTLGDMAMPGRPLMTLYDPAAMRVTTAVPESSGRRLEHAGAEAPSVELPATGTAPVRPTRWTLLPAADPATHTVVVRLDLPAGTAASPGMFARAWLPTGAAGSMRITIPARAVVRRAELNGVYVIGSNGRPLLRQIRLGPVDGDQVEVLAGLRSGERVAIDPQVAGRLQ